MQGRIMKTSWLSTDCSWGSRGIEQYEDPEPWTQEKRRESIGRKFNQPQRNGQWWKPVLDLAVLMDRGDSVSGRTVESRLRYNHQPWMESWLPAHAENMRWKLAYDDEGANHVKSKSIYASRSARFCSKFNTNVMFDIDGESAYRYLPVLVVEGSRGCNSGE